MLCFAWHVLRVAERQGKRFLQYFKSREKEGSSDSGSQSQYRLLKQTGHVHQRWQTIAAQQFTHILRDIGILPWLPLSLSDRKHSAQAHTFYYRIPSYFLFPYLQQSSFLIATSFPGYSHLSIWDRGDMSFPPKAFCFVCLIVLFCVFQVFSYL